MIGGSFSMDEVDFRPGVVAAEAEADRAVGGGERARPSRAARARAPASRRCRPSPLMAQMPCSVEQQQDRLALDVLEADVGRVGQPVVSVSPLTRLFGHVRAGACFEPVAQALHARCSRRPCVWAASSQALPSPTMPGTFSVPPRRPPSWWPPIRKGASACPCGRRARRRPWGRAACGRRGESRSIAAFRRGSSGSCRPPARRRCGRRCPGLVTISRDLLDGEDHAGLVVGPHDADEGGVVVELVLQLVEVDRPTLPSTGTTVTR